MKNRKYLLLGISFIGSCLLVLIKYAELVYVFRNILGREYLEVFFNTLVFFPFVLFFSLLTYKMPNRVFSFWWKFARYAIPVVLGLVILVNLRLHHTTGGFFNVDTAIDSLLVVILYGLFILGSVVSVVWGYRTK
jgi:hypothetical protein